MGNSLSESQTDQRRREPLERAEQGKALEDLPITFSCLYNNVMSLVQATVAQQKLVDALCEMSTAEAIDEKTLYATLKSGRDILQKMQEPFGIDSPFLKRSKDDQEWNRHKVAARHQVIDDNLVPAALNEKHQKELAMLNKELLEKQKYEKRLEEARAKACFKIIELENSIDNLKKEQKDKDSMNAFLHNENERLTREIEELKPPKVSGTIQIYHSHSGNTIKDIETALKALLKCQLNDIDFIKCSTLSDVDHSSPLIVLSIIASRVGTDAANAIKGVPCPGNTALLLFHIKEIHALTKQSSTTVLTDRSFKELGGLQDMAFVNGKGIYQCEMNDHALKGVCAFIKNVVYGTGI